MTSSKTKADLVVVIPFGPNATADDAIESVQVYAGKSHAIVVIDDTHDERTAPALKKLGKDVYVFPAPTNLPTGTHGGLYLKMVAALAWIEENFAYKAVLRLDTDALVIGFQPEVEAMRLFEANGTYGLLGSYRYDCNNVYRNTSGIARRFLAEIYAGWLKKPQLSRALYKIWRGAKRNGYVNGDHCLGGAVFMSAAFVKSLTGSPLCTSQALKDCELGDDHMFGLVAAYLGFKLVDFAPDPLPMGLRGVGLPDTPENLVRRNKKIIHSVKPRDTEVLQYFRTLRAKDS